jgi:hypothetical protein
MTPICGRFLGNFSHHPQTITLVPVQWTRRQCGTFYVQLCYNQLNAQLIQSGVCCEAKESAVLS